VANALLMRLDQQPLSACLNGSDLPKPAKGSLCVSRIRRIMRSACARSCSTHQARSSNAATSNSKLLNGCLEPEPGLPMRRLQQAILHGFALQQVRGFPLRLDLPPEFDGHDDCGRLAALAAPAGNVASALRGRSLMRMNAIYSNANSRHVWRLISFRILRRVESLEDYRHRIEESAVGGNVGGFSGPNIQAANSLHQPRVG
jgi:hypothetical protein